MKASKLQILLGCALMALTSNAMQGQGCPKQVTVAQMNDFAREGHAVVDRKVFTVDNINREIILRIRPDWRNFLTKNTDSLVSLISDEFPNCTYHFETLTGRTKGDFTIVHSGVEHNKAFELGNIQPGMGRGSQSSLPAPHRGESMFGSHTGEEPEPGEVAAPAYLGSHQTPQHSPRAERRSSEMPREAVPQSEGEEQLLSQQERETLGKTLPGLMTPEGSPEVAPRQSRTMPPPPARRATQEELEAIKSDRYAAALSAKLRASQAQKQQESNEYVPMPAPKRAPPLPPVPVVPEDAPPPPRIDQLPPPPPYLPTEREEPGREGLNTSRGE